MQVTYIGLSEYFQRCIPKAKRKGYFLIISLIARYSDAQDLYEKLEKDWASLNDLTGDKILFVFSTPKARKRASFFHIPGKEPYEGVMCPFIELLNGRGVEDNNGSFEFQYGGYNKIDWKQRHSQTITEFAMNYNILEKEIPCLFLYDLIGNRYKVIPVGQSTDIYVMIKAMVEEIAEYRKKCVNIEGQLEKYRKIEEYYCLYEKLENEAEKENSKQCVAIRKVLREVQSYKEVKDDIFDSRIKKDLKRIGQWKRQYFSSFEKDDANKKHGIYFSDRKREELFPKLQKVVDKVVRRMQDIVNLRGVVLDNVSGFENQMQNILVLAANKFSQAQIKSLNEYTKNKLIVPAKNEYIRKIDEIESNPEALKAIISAPDYFLDSYKKARLVGRVIKILVDEYGLVIDKKYNKFVEVYYNEIIKYRNALGHAMRSNEHADREVFIGEIDKTPLIFTEDLFRQMRASLNEYQQVINLVENSFNQI